MSRVTPSHRPRVRSLAVRDHLVSRIRRGALPPGSQLPPEPELASELGVSRPTLREALRLLEDEGLVTRTPGAGTFIAARPRVSNNLADNFGVTDAIRAAGMEPGFEDASVGAEPASASEAERLGLRPGEDLVAIERVRTADGRPVVLSRDLIPAQLIGDDREVLDLLVHGSVYEVLERSLGIVIHHGVAGIHPVRAGGTVGRKLRVSVGTLLLYLEQIDYSEDGRPVLSSDEYHLADAFEFMVVRRGPGRRFT